MADNVYSVEFTIHATAYIRETSEEGAKKAALLMQGVFADLPTNDTGWDESDGSSQVCISDKSYSDEDLPRFSFSPAVTLGEPDLDSLELAQDNANRQQAA